MAKENILSVSLKSYIEQTQNLQAELLKLTKGSEEYEKKAKEIAERQRALNESFNLSKKESKALEGSYKAMAQEMSKLKKEWRETNDEARRDELGKQINNLNNQLKSFDASIGVFNRNVGDYANQFTQALSQMGISMGGATKAFQLASTAGVGFNSVLNMLKAHPFIAVATLLVGIFLKLKDAINKNEESSNKWKVAMSAFQPILNAITNAIDWLAGKLADLVLYISTSLPKVLNWLGGFSKGFFNVIGNIVDAITYIPKTLSKVMQTVVDYTFKGINAIAGKVGELLSAVGLDDWAGKVVNASKSAGDALQGFYQGAEKMFAGAGNAVRNFGSSVQSALNSAGKTVETYQQKARNGIKLEQDLRAEQIKTAESEKRQAELREQIAKATGKEKIALEKQLQKEIMTTAKRQSELAKRQYEAALSRSKLTPNSKEDNERLAQLKAAWITAENAATMANAKIEQKIQSQEQAIKKASEASAKAAQQAAEKAQKAIEKAGKEALKAYNDNFKAVADKATTETNNSKSEEELFKSAGLLTPEMMKKYADDRYNIQKKALEEELKLTNEAINNAQILEQDKVALALKASNLIIQQQSNENAHQTELNKIWLDERKKMYDEDVKNYNQAYGEEVQGRASGMSSNYVDISDKYLQGKISYQEYQEEIQNLQDEYNRIESEKEIEHQEELLAIKKQFLDDQLKQFGDSSEQYAKAKEEYDAQELALEKKKTEQLIKTKDKDVKNDQKTKDKKKKTQDQQLRAYSSFSDGMQALMGENSKAAKALAITDAIVNTWLGASNVLKEGPKPYGGGIWGTVAMYANMAGVIATGLANVKSIMSEKQDGGSSGGGAAGASAAPALSSAVVSPLLNDMEDYNNMNNQPLRVYVTESDISNTQNKVRVTENDSTF